MTSGRLSIDLIGTDMEIKNRLRNILSELIDGDGYPFERRNGYGAKVFQETFWRLVKQRWTSYVPERRKKKGDKAQKGDTLIFV
jgi:proline dehydrogenase